eukprot:TRINITY_DN37339_c0_g1_i1.p1 TRINITY_DN37339_c0_g1~~TRINITY_DN37339_c0_g1_i1.p1  ORF type:complete len:309 (-),score=58.23 TRINITY_DN37339_c0_g1_i1:209-1135(-)
MWLDRPAAVNEAIHEKFCGASTHRGWVQDSPANYDFGSYGVGVDVARVIFKRRLSEGHQARVLDVGCASGGFLSALCDLTSELGATAYLRGVTAGNETNERLKNVTHRVVETGKDVQLLHAVCRDCTDDTPRENDNVDVRLYQQCLVEKLLVAEVDFIREGQTFDLIVCSWTLLHLCDPLGTLLQLRQLLADGGILLANEFFFHVEGHGVESGSREAMDVALTRFLPSLEYEVVGEPLRWVPKDPEDDSQWADGDYQGGYRSNLRWVAMTAEQPGATVTYTGEVVDRVWQLVSGAQRMLAAYAVVTDP